MNLETDHPIALDSYDHIYPELGIEDYSYNLAFNAKVYQLFKPPISVLDLGCGFGLFVKTLLDEGNEAIGLEGSDLPKNLGRGAWSQIPNHLMTCDITHIFRIYRAKNEIYLFDLITAWEVIEHIKEDCLTNVWLNVQTHLKPNGLFIITTPTSVGQSRKKLDHHRTRRPGKWWQAEIEKSGFKRDSEIEDFFGEDWVRVGSNIRHVYRHD